MRLPESVTWKGQQWSVPSMDELESMVVECESTTPEGEAVEPDHEDSWLSLLHLI